MSSCVSKLFKIRLATCFAIALLLAGIPEFSPAAGLTERNLTLLWGSVGVSRGESSPLTAGAGGIVKAGDRISTTGDSYAEMVTPDGVVVRLAPNTSILLNKGLREFTLEKGSMLLQVPRGARSSRIVAQRVIGAVSDGTILGEHSPAQYAKFIVLAGTARSSIQGRFGEWSTIEAGRMLILPPDSTSLPDSVDVDLTRIVATSGLVRLRIDGQLDKGIRGHYSREGIESSAALQQASIVSGDFVKTNLLMLSGASLTVASDNLLQTRENRSNALLNTSKDGTYTIDSASTLDMRGSIVRGGLPVGTGEVYGNPLFTTFGFSDLVISGGFNVTIPPGAPNRLELYSQGGISVTGPFSVNSGLTTMKLAAAAGPLTITKTLSASTPALSIADRAGITQASGEYYGVDYWQTRAPIAAGTRLVHGASSDAASTTIAYSNYFATEQALTDAMVGSNADARLYNGFVQVAPFRNPAVTGDFTYRPYVVTYEVMRSLPVTYALVANNPQHNTTGSGAGHDQYYTPFRRQDLIRLGYIKPVESVSCSNTVTDIPRYVGLSGSTTTYDVLNALAKDDYYTYFNASAPEDLAEAERLRIEATAIRTNQRRSSQEVIGDAAGSGGDILLTGSANIDGFARVGLTANRNITIGGGILGADVVSATAGGDLSIPEGGLVEVFTDNRASGGGSITLTGDKTLNIGGRIQASSSPWIMGTSGEKAGSITVESTNADPGSVAIDVTSSGQILALLRGTTATSGRADVRLTSAGGRIGIDGLKVGGANYGQNIAADYGDLTIFNNGTRGSIDILGGAGLQADILKIGALGTEGVLNIYAGSRMDANTQIKLFGGTLSGGAVVFGGTGTINLISPGVLISADKVQVNTGVYVNTGAVAADVYANKRHWSPAQGGDAGSPQMGTWSTTPSNKGTPLGSGSF